jgi:hypothetical protein
VIKTKGSHLLLFLFFFFSLSISAQTKEDNIPLDLALTKIEQLYKLNFSYADENLKNKFIKLPLTILSIDALLVYLNSNTDLSFERISSRTIIVRDLTKNSFETQFLEEILVTEFLTKGIALKDDGVTTINPSKFGILPGLIEPDVLQTIQALPGVTSVDERVSNLNVRGGTNDQNLMLWDGIKMYQSGHFFGLISAFSPYLTHEVKVSKNGTSAMYGDGVSSIIDMKSSSAISDKISSGFGFNMISTDAFTKIPLSDKLELQLSVRRSLTDLIKTPTYDTYYKRIFQDTDLTQITANSISSNETFYFYDTSSKLTFDVTPKDKITFNSLIIYNNLNYDEQSSINNVNEALQSNLTQKNLAFGIQHQRTWNEKLETYAQVYLSNYNLFALNFDVINNQRLIQENEVYDGGLKLHAKYKLDETLGYFGGYQFTEVGISNLEDVLNPDYRKKEKKVLRTHSIFNEVKFLSPSKNTSTRLGIRTNYIEKFSEFYFEPRLSITQKFLNTFRFEILGEIKSQSTTQIIDLQNDFLGIEKRRWVLANNEDTPVLESKQVSAGLHFNKNNLIISAEAFFKTVEGITTRSQGFQNQYQFVNEIGNYDVQGFDIMVNKKIRDFSTWLSYSYSENNYKFKNLNSGNEFPNNSDIRHAINFACAYNYNNFKVSAGINWKSGKPYTEPNSDNPSTENVINYTSPNSSNLNDYFRADISANYSFKIYNTNAEIGLSIWNVLDKVNTINTYFITTNASISKVENESLGITPNASLRIKF